MFDFGFPFPKILSLIVFSFMHVTVSKRLVCYISMTFARNVTWFQQNGKQKGLHEQQITSLKFELKTGLLSIY